MKYQIIRCDSSGQTRLAVRFDNYLEALKFADALPRHEATHFAIVPARTWAHSVVDFIDTCSWEPTGWAQTVLAVCAFVAFFLALVVLAWLVMNLR